MKEQSIEEKAKAYDIALKKIKMLLGAGSNCSREELEHLLPELKESEDEKIRKEILEFFQQFENEELRGVNISDWIDWLEKQGEYAKFRDSIQVGDKVTRNQDGVLVNLSQLKRVAKPTEKQGEQKPVEPQQDMLSQEKYAKAVDECIYGEQKTANKVEPKFKHGDRVRNKKSGLEQTLGSCIEDVYEGAFPFRIKDQDDWELVEQKPADKVEPKFKVGDKIRKKTPSSFDRDMQVARIEKDYYVCNHIGKFSSEVVPFSKQSRYELVEQNLAWSDEDEQYLLVCKNALAKYQVSDKWDANIISRWLENRLKSLRPQSKWKPTEEQTEIIDMILTNEAMDDNVANILRELKEQLKTL